MKEGTNVSYGCRTRVTHVAVFDNRIGQICSKCHRCGGYKGVFGVLREENSMLYDWKQPDELPKHRLILSILLL